MLKKILLGLAGVATLAVLIVGGINRTAAKTSDEYGTGSRSGRGQNAQSEVVYNLDEKFSGGNGSETGQGRGRSTGSENIVGVSAQAAAAVRGNGQGRSGGSTGSGGNGGGSRQAGATGEPLALAEEQFTELTTLQGSVASVDLADEVLINVDGGQIVLEGRSLSFAVSQGFTAQAGDEMVLTGFYDGEDFEVVQLTNQTSQQVIQLRESSGRPLWAGGGRIG